VKLRHVIVFLSGVLFSLGLGIAGMTQPAKIVGFLDFTGRWDASLAIAMVGAVTVHLISYRLIRRRRAPLLAPAFAVPSSDRIDARLLVGAAVFGLGWGLAGYCPGPAFVSIATGGPVLVLVVGMLGGMALHEAWLRARRPAPGHAPEPAGKASQRTLEIEVTPGA
jgi:hypothetical protein